MTESAVGKDGQKMPIVGAALLILNTPALRNLNGDPGPTRVHLYQDALHMVAARPISGWGEDATGLVFGRFLSGDWSPGVTFDRAHSGLLDLMATQGILGMASLGIVKTLRTGIVIGVLARNDVITPIPFRLSRIRTGLSGK